METVFYIAAFIAILSTLMVITRVNAVHALLYLVVSLLAVAVIFYLLGAPFVAALEVIIYAGAIMVLLIFVIMMLNLGEKAAEQEKSWLSPGMWVGPGIMALILLGDIIYVLVQSQPENFVKRVVGPKEVSLALFGPYILGVELAAILLLAGIVGAYHLGKRKKRVQHRFLEIEKEEDKV